MGKMVRHDPCHPDLVAEAVYGLPELNREQIRNARLVANPGCYPTAVQLGFLPLIEAGCVDIDHLIADAKSGVSGAGRKAETHILFAEASDNFKAYGVAGHRHLPEIRQGLSGIAGASVGLDLRAPSDADDSRHPCHAVRAHHARRGFPVAVREALCRRAICGCAAAKSHPETRSVRAANTCRIAVHRPQGGDTLVVLSVIDNLVKGAAGQAVQNMNLMFGLDECLGLSQVPVLP